MRHASALACTIEVTTGDSWLRLRIANDSVPDAASGQTAGGGTGYGLANMAARVEAAGGYLAWQAGGWFELAAEIPVIGAGPKRARLGGLRPFLPARRPAKPPYPDDPLAAGDGAGDLSGQLVLEQAGADSRTLRGGYAARQQAYLAAIGAFRAADSRVVRPDPQWRWLAVLRTFPASAPLPSARERSARPVLPVSQAPAGRVHRGSIGSGDHLSDRGPSSYYGFVPSPRRRAGT